jgi:hypothetical protein
MVPITVNHRHKQFHHPNPLPIFHKIIKIGVTHYLLLMGTSSFHEQNQVLFPATMFPFYSHQNHPKLRGPRLVANMPAPQGQ